jgi:hypothetical protein
VDVRIESFIRTATRALSGSTLALALLAPATGFAADSETEPAKNAAPATAPSKASAPAKAAPKVPADGKVVMDFTPSAGPWRDRLRDARRNLLDATAALDDVSAQYARTLYETPDDSEQIAELAKMREAAAKRAAAARAVIPGLIEQARADGVDPETLRAYEDVTLDPDE